MGLRMRRRQPGSATAEVGQPVSNTEVVRGPVSNSLINTTSGIAEGFLSKNQQVHKTES